MSNKVLLPYQIYGYDVYFPVDEKLVIMIGMNGSYKSTTLRLLKKYYEERGESVLYFPDDRALNVTKEQMKSAAVAMHMQGSPFFQEHGIKIDMIEEHLYEKMLYGGFPQVTNFFTQITLAKNPSVVLIDEPERNLSITVKQDLIKTLMSLPNTKQLIVATHCPCILSDYMSKAVSMPNIVMYKKEPAE